VLSAAGSDVRGCPARGIVTATQSGRVEIELAAPPRCHGCDGACSWYEIGSRRRRVVLATERAFRVGAAVSIQMAGRYWIMAAVIVYGLPLAALLAGAALGFAAAGTEFATAVGAAAGFAGAAALGRRLRRYSEHLTLRSLVVEPVDGGGNDPARAL
jgi:positive regulator of sigma E activity